MKKDKLDLNLGQYVKDSDFQEQIDYLRSLISNNQSHHSRLKDQDANLTTRLEVIEDRLNGLT